MLCCIRLCFVFMLIVNKIICRSIESNTVSTIIDDVNQFNVSTTMTTPTTTMMDAVLLTTTTESPARTFDICEYFETDNEIDVLKLRSHGITVVTKLF